MTFVARTQVLFFVHSMSQWGPVLIWISMTLTKQKQNILIQVPGNDMNMSKQ